MVAGRCSLKISLLVLTFLPDCIIDTRRPEGLSMLPASTDSKDTRSKKKHKRRRRQKSKSKMSDSPRKPLSEEELADHVNSRYSGPTIGHGAAFDIDESTAGGRAKTESMTQEHFLKELNKRPALVLNADFQVGLLY